MPAGRPPLFESPEVLQQKVDAYFAWIQGEFHEEEQPVTIKRKKTTVKVKVWDRHPEPSSITGLVLFLGFVSRQSLSDYCERGDEFSDIVKRAKTRVEHGYEKALWGTTPTGPIFALKQMGWTDKQELTGKNGEKLFDPNTYTDEQLAAVIAAAINRSSTGS